MLGGGRGGQPRSRGRPGWAASLSLGDGRARLRRLPRRRVGPSRPRRPRPVREAHASRRFQSGLSWLDDPAQARGASGRPSRASTPSASPRSAPPTCARLLADAGIVRNRAKIDATIANARAALERVPGRAWASSSWSFAPGPAIGPARARSADVPADDAGVDGDGQELKRRGFRFVGPTTAYALMQACGLVNDHLGAVRRSRHGRGGEDGHRADRL